MRLRPGRRPHWGTLQRSPDLWLVSEGRFAAGEVRGEKKKKRGERRKKEGNGSVPHFILYNLTTKER